MEASLEMVIDEDAEEEDEMLDASVAANRENLKANCSKHGPQLTAIKELMFCIAYIKASKYSIHGSKQRITLFKVQLQITYNGIKKDQVEQEDAYEAEKPSHLKPAGCTVSMVPYSECKGRQFNLPTIYQKHHL